MVSGFLSCNYVYRIRDLNPPLKHMMTVSWLIHLTSLYVFLNHSKKDNNNSSSLCLMLARSPRVFGIVLVVLNLSRNVFSKVWQESIVLDFSKVNHVNVLFERVPEKALQRIALSLVTSPIVNLYRYICSRGHVCLEYKTNGGIFSVGSNATPWTHFSKGPISMDRTLFECEVRLVCSGLSSCRYLFDDFPTSSWVLVGFEVWWLSPTSLSPSDTWDEIVHPAFPLFCLLEPLSFEDGCQTILHPGQVGGDNFCPALQNFVHSLIHYLERFCSCLRHHSLSWVCRVFSFFLHHSSFWIFFS